jgi:hypothetical protein
MDMTAEITTMASMMYVIMVFGKNIYEATPNNAQAISMATQFQYFIQSSFFLKNSIPSPKARNGTTISGCFMKAKAIPLATAPKKHISLFFIAISPSLSIPANSSHGKIFHQ